MRSISDRPPPIASSHLQHKVARNLTWSAFERPHKRCNFNEPISNSEIVGEELRATLLGKGRGDTRTAPNDRLTTQGPNDTDIRGSVDAVKARPNDPLTTNDPNDLPFLGL